MVDEIGEMLVAEFAISLITGLLSFGGYLMIFWLLDQTQFLTVNVSLFLDKFAVPFILAVVLMRIFWRILGVAGSAIQ